MFFLIFPLFRVFVWSFYGESGTMTITSTFTFHWYKNVFQSSQWINALRTSLFYASISTSIAFILTLIYFYFSILYKSIYKLFGNSIIIIPLFFPILLYAISLKIIGSRYFIPEYLLVIIGHISLIIPIQYFILQSSEENISKDWILGSIIMGASHSEIIKKVLVPNIKSAVFISIACGFLFSFDELVVSNFIIDSANATIPKKIWSDITRDINPESGVIYIILFLLNVIFVLIISILKKVNISFIMKNIKLPKTMFFREWKQTISYALVAFFLAILIELGFTGTIHFVPAIIAGTFVAVGFEILKQIYMLNNWGYSIIDQVYTYRNSKPDKVKSLSINLLGLEMESAIQVSNELLSSQNGFSVSREKNQKIYEVLFSTNKREYYFGTDSNVPSVFNSLYPNFLTLSQNYKTSARILLCNFDDLERDLTSKKNDFEGFYNWHIDNNASLLFHNSNSAKQKMNIHGLINSDLGIFDDNYIIIFMPRDNNTIQYWVKSHDVSAVTTTYIRFYLTLIESPDTKVIKYNEGILSLEELSKGKKQEITRKIKNLWKIQ